MLVVVGELESVFVSPQQEPRPERGFVAGGQRRVAIA
jgi:hypothetical protein